MISKLFWWEELRGSFSLAYATNLKQASEYLLYDKGINFCEYNT